MAHGHRDRLTALDASFVAQERGAFHMHVGAVTVFDGPAPGYGELLEHIERRLHLVPRYRQKLAFPPLGLGRPFWVDDPFFTLEYHVRDTALPNPGSTQQLRELVARTFSQRLDRSKPLWELTLVQGLEEGGFAVVWKLHHALVDGVAGVDLAGVLFDASPMTSESPSPNGERAWTPPPAPSAAQMAGDAVRGAVRKPLDLADRAVRALQDPERAFDQARGAIEGLGNIAWEYLNPAPETPLNVEIGPHRRVRWLDSRLDDFKEIKDELGGTVNDVFLAVVTGALRRWLPTRGVRTEGLELRAEVPLSVRLEDERGRMGNKIVAMRGALPVYEADPVERLRTIAAEMRDLKASRQARGAAAVLSLQDLVPPVLLTQATRINMSTVLFNLLVTNIPGPRFPLYLLGRELQRLIPVAFLPENQALAIAIMSYHGRVEWGLIADYDAMPDLEDIAGHLEASLAELARQARRAGEVEVVAPATPEGGGVNGGGRPAADAEPAGEPGVPEEVEAARASSAGS